MNNLFLVYFVDTLRKSMKADGKFDAKLVEKYQSEPSREYESYRRRAYRDVQELWFFARSNLESLKKEKGSVESKINEIVGELETREQVVLMDLDMLKESDGHEEWRQSEAHDLSELVQVIDRQIIHEMYIFKTIIDLGKTEISAESPELQHCKETCL